jgi:hypothetical protein
MKQKVRRGHMVHEAVGISQALESGCQRTLVVEMDSDAHRELQEGEGVVSETDRISARYVSTIPRSIRRRLGQDIIPAERSRGCVTIQFQRTGIRCEVGT